LRLDALNEYFANEQVDVLGRVTLLSEDQVSYFWLYRGRKDALSSPVVGEQIGDVTHWPAEAVWPVMYVLDEAHLYWHAREWAKIGRGVLWYLSQHRKRGDTIVWISQAPGHVDKQFRALTQDWTTCRNWALERLAGFAMPKRFRLEISLEPPDRVGRTVMETRSFRPDPKLFGLYDTTAGVGMPGAMKPEPPPARRPSVAWLVVGACVLIIAGAWLVPRAVGKIIGGAAQAVAASASIPSALIPSAAEGAKSDLPAATTNAVVRVDDGEWIVTAKVGNMTAWENPKTGQALVWTGQRLRWVKTQQQNYESQGVGITRHETQLR
jgi:hypothetical protein